MKKYWYITLISILVIFSLVIIQFFSSEENESTNKQEIDKAKVVITSFLFDLKEINNINNNSLKLFKPYSSLNNEDLKEYFKYYNLTERKIQIDEIEVNRFDLLERAGNEYTFIVNATIHGTYEDNEAINERLFSKFTLTKKDSTFVISKIEKILSGNRLEQ